MIQIPEVSLKSIIDAILARIRSDYTGKVDKATTFLYNSLYGLKIGTYDFYEQAIEILCKPLDDPRRIDTRLMFDRERASLPTIHVTIPSENPYSDGIGFDEGYQDVMVDNEDNPTAITAYLTRAYNSRFECLITGSNTFEVVLIFYLLKMGLIINKEALEINGFRNPKVYGGDVRINEQIAPVAFMRVLTLDSLHELSVPNMDSVSIINTIKFEGTMYE